MMDRCRSTKKHTRYWKFYMLFTFMVYLAFLLISPELYSLGIVLLSVMGLHAVWAYADDYKFGSQFFWSVYLGLLILIDLGLPFYFSLSSDSAFSSFVWWELFYSIGVYLTFRCPMYYAIFRYILSKEIWISSYCDSPESDLELSPHLF